MIKGISGDTILVEKDITDILRQHFARSGQGFKHITYAIDSAERDKPRFEIDLSLEPINKANIFSPKLVKLLHELISKCSTNIDIEKNMLKELYKWVRSEKITEDEFVVLIQRIKGE